MPFHFHKPQKSPTQTHSSETLPPSNKIPISILHISLSGTCSRLSTTYTPTSPSLPHNSHTYPIPALIASTTPLHLLILEFTPDYIPLHLKDSPTQQALCGVYCLWYQERTERPRTVEEYVELESGGGFWMVRQLQWRPEGGERVAYEDVPEGMESAMEGWWGRGVVLPRVRAAMRGTENTVH